MNLMRPTPLSYDPALWATLPFPERARLVCQAWAIQGYGSPLGAYGFYAFKVALYIAGFVVFCRFNAGYASDQPLLDQLLTPIAFQKAICWSMLFEGLGLGCGSGPLTGRYVPPFGGALHFLRPGTTKLPLFPRLPLIGGIQRSWLDVLLYAALLGALVRGLIAPQIGSADAWSVVLLTAALTRVRLLLSFRELQDGAGLFDLATDTTTQPPPLSGGRRRCRALSFATATRPGRSMRAQIQKLSVTSSATVDHPRWPSCP